MEGVIEDKMDKSNSELAAIHSIISQEDLAPKVLYYISDLHLEHQLECSNKSEKELCKGIISKVKELVSSAEDTEKPLLIAGDTADSFKLASLFYNILLSLWKGRIIVVLGNHELWDTHDDKNRSADEIINRYKEFGKKNQRIVFLENELLMVRHNKWEIMSESDFLDEKKQFYLQWKFDFCSLIVLGGVGFSGNNPLLNAKNGTYQNKITREEDISRSERFSSFHEAVRLSSGNNRVVVLSHNPPGDWCSHKLCSNWIYICGHNHQNSFSSGNHGPTILNDNQIGYEPKKWSLKRVYYGRNNKYDPFEDLQDGVHCVSIEEYKNFCRCAGIYMPGLKRRGKIFAIKQSGVYMFLNEEKKLYVLQGGKRLIAEHDISYYMSNLSQYVSQIRKAFAHYYSEMQRLSEEIRKLGGWGSIHGCIIDIDFWNHIYCDPRDGKISFYYATDMINKMFYPDFMHLINESPALSCKDYILKRLKSGEGLSDLLSVADSDSLPTVPEIVLDTSMYNPSRKMRSVQYVLENNVVRFWNDAILNYDFEKDLQLKGLNSNAEIRECSHEKDTIREREMKFGEEGRMIVISIFDKPEEDGLAGIITGTVLPCIIGIRVYEDDDKEDVSVSVKEDKSIMIGLSPTMLEKIRERNHTSLLAVFYQLGRVALGHINTLESRKDEKAKLNKQKNKEDMELETAAFVEEYIR